ncbi:MAG: HigA family addiction module antitoxin [Gelidibacter sp.]
MLPELYKIKGLHPGLILKREIERNNIKSSELAHAISEHKQTISAIINQRRGINPDLSIKLAEYFNTDEDYFMMLQASYEVKKTRTSNKQYHPNFKNIRKVLFWDTVFEEIDWDKNKKAVIKRVLERGNDKEINEIILFYGKDHIIKELKTIKKSLLPTFEKNIKTYNLI